MSTSPVFLPVTDPASVSGSQDNPSSATAPSAAPTDPRTGNCAKMIEKIENLFHPVTTDVPLIQPALPDLHSIRTPKPKTLSSGPQVQPTPVTDTPSHQLIAGLSAACGSNTPMSLGLQPQDSRQRATSMQPLGHDASALMSQGIPLPGLNLLRSRMVDNQNNLSVGLVGAQDHAEIPAIVEFQRALDQQHDSQNSSGVKVLGEFGRAVSKVCSSGQPEPPQPSARLAHSPTLDKNQSLAAFDQQVNWGSAHGYPLNDRNTRSLAVRPRTTSQQPVIQQGHFPIFSVGNDGAPSGVKRPSSSFEQAHCIPASSDASLADVQGSYLSPGQPQYCVNVDDNSSSGPRRYQQPFGGQVMSQPTVPGQPITTSSISEDFFLIKKGHLSANRRALGQSLIPEEELSGLSVAESYDLIARTLSQQSTPRLPPPGLPVRGYFVWAEAQAETSVAEQLTLSSAVTAVSNKDSKPEVLAPGNNAYGFTSGEDQCYQHVPQRPSSSFAAPDGARKPVFGFSSTSEAENFRPAPRKSFCGGYGQGFLPHGDQYPQMATQGDDLSQPVRKKIIFGFPSVAAALNSHQDPEGLENPIDVPFASKGNLKLEPASLTPSINHQTVDGGSEPNSSAQIWGSFAPYDTSVSNTQHLSNFGNSAGSNGGGFTQVFLGDPLPEMELGEALDPNRYTNAGSSLVGGDSHIAGDSNDHVSAVAIFI